MKKSLFKKYLSVTSIIIVVSFLFLGTVMIVFIARYFQSEKQAQLTQNAKSMAIPPRQQVMLYHRRFTPKKSKRNRLREANPISDWFGPTGFTSMVLMSTVNSRKIRNKNPVTIKFFFEFFCIQHSFLWL